jgi:hypothetical protein
MIIIASQSSILYRDGARVSLRCSTSPADAVLLPVEQHSPKLLPESARRSAFRYAGLNFISHFTIEPARRASKTFARAQGLLGGSMPHADAACSLARDAAAVSLPPTLAVDDIFRERTRIISFAARH